MTPNYKTEVLSCAVNHKKTSMHWSMNYITVVHQFSVNESTIYSTSIKRKEEIHRCVCEAPLNNKSHIQNASWNYGRNGKVAG